MASNTAETLIGAAVLAVAGGFMFYAAQTADIGGVGGGYYDVKAAFRKASGIASGADVRVSGVKVGAVSGLSLDPKTYRAVASLSIRDDVKIPEDSVVTITSDGLLGGSYVAIDPGASDFYVTSGEELTNTQGSVDLLDLLSKAVAGN
ncbi:outer membrane lipid asymmetry maintenance protein MlaD [Pikeienuella piscinae]|uniref:Outer membrane lipid asymmetry maintenance protein MlaD n=1 Tax=Pikeienuella piscinae TaxID=2748098 RepID=A0A7L5BVN5_9RHOB|nr:outer membrane lipid asymmetry maintenance protein MlaD [Pikeienuella piscinae]QIE54567.1 outer membrane lipid asymmetry maintenance protein MlaD [Pikeienuella piscinae]